MSNNPPIPRLTVITLGVSNMRASIAFYEALGFARRIRSTGEAVAFFDTGGPVIGAVSVGSTRAGRDAAGQSAAEGPSAA